MKRSTYFIPAIILLLLISSVCDIQAQRNARYQKLSISGERPSQFFDFVILPGETDGVVEFVSVFSLSYRNLPFKKFNQSGSSSTERAFFSPANLNMEIFNSNKEQLQRQDDKVSVEGMEPAGRSFWEDTAYAETYEQTQSELAFLQGHIGMELKPGIYTYVLQMKRGERSDSQLSRTRTIRLESYSDMKVGNVLLGEELSSDQQGEPQLTLMSMGKNVKYGSDFYALAYIPNYDSEASYRIEVNTLKESRGNTTVGQQVFSHTLESGNIRINIKPKLVTSGEKKNTLRLASDPDGFTYALVKIPNSTFENASYRLTVNQANSSESVSETGFRSMWIDMPRSLLSLDTATDMLRYIVEDETLDNLSEGSREERERKFRAFWEKRDPTPDTQYNELMAEYYRRIDYAYQNFSTSNKIGYESDQGEVYIKFGPPKDIKRKFPTDGATVEIWTYPDREFVFRATSGFGDFRLVSSE